MISGIILLVILALVVYGAWPVKKNPNECDPMDGGDEWHLVWTEEEIHIIPPADKK